jgi:hypothetical protein
VNNNLVKHGDNGSKLTITLVLKIVKFVARFFSNVENHIMEGSVPDSVPNFTPRDVNPKIIQAATAIAPVGRVAALKAKSDASPPGTPTRKRNGKKQKIKPAAEGKDFTKAGLFCCKEGTPILDLFPSNLEKKYCSFFCFHDKKCSKPNQACNFDHIRKWDKIPAKDQLKILEHCKVSKSEKYG